MELEADLKYCVIVGSGTV